MAQNHIAIPAVVACLFLSAMPRTVAAQQADPASPQDQQGPMIVERVQNGFAIAPDFKLTKVDGSSARLAGAYGGWLIDNTLLIGAGGYWLTNQSDARKMGYGGAVVEWLQGIDRPIGFSVKGLIGFGEATLSDSLGNVAFQYDHDGRLMSTDLRPPFDRHHGEIRTVNPGGVRLIFNQSFFIAEPQANLLVSLTRRLRLDMGVGYRLIAGTDGVDTRLRGATGSIALQFGGSSSRRRQSP